MTVKLISEGGKSQSASLNKSEKKNYKESESKSADSVFTPKADILELSDEARKTVNIQNRIQNGFYDKSEVLEKVAKKLSALV